MGDKSIISALTINNVLNVVNCIAGGCISDDTAEWPDLDVRRGVSFSPVLVHSVR